MRRPGRQPGFRLSAASRAKISAGVRAACAASPRWRAPPGREAEYIRLRSEVGASEAKRMIDIDAARAQKKSFSSISSNGDGNECATHS